MTVTSVEPTHASGTVSIVEVVGLRLHQLVELLELLHAPIRHTQPGDCANKRRRVLVIDILEAKA
jgi:hypothetical protein